MRETKLDAPNCPEFNPCKQFSRGSKEEERDRRKRGYNARVLRLRKEAAQVISEWLQRWGK